MSDPDRPNWFKRLSSSTTTSLRSLGLPISPSTSPTQPPSSFHEYEQANMKEKSATSSDRTSRQSSIRQFRPSRQPSSATSENSVGSSIQTDRPTADRIRHTGSLQSIIQNPNGNHAHHTHTATRSYTHPQPHQHQVGGRSRSLRVAPGLRGPQLGPMSSAGFPDSLFHASEFMLGAGMVILQPSTARIVIVHETKRNYWFLPKGRKDVGESLEQAALREAYEESGYRAELLPLYILTHAPTPPGDHLYSSYRIPRRNTEPIYMSTHKWEGPRWPQGSECTGGEYLTFWYVGQIPHDAVRESNTGMPDEVNYLSELVDLRTALQRLGGLERSIVMRAFELWTQDADNDRQVQEAIRMIQKEEETRASRRVDDTRAVPVTAYGSGSGGGSGRGDGADTIDA